MQMILTPGVLTTLTAVLTGIIGTLIAVIYNTLANRINGIGKAYTKTAVDISSIKTDIKWIKNKITKL